MVLEIPMWKPFSSKLLLVISLVMISAHFGLAKDQGNVASEIVDLINQNRSASKLPKLFDSKGLGCMALQYISECIGNCSSNNTLKCQPPELDITEVYAPNCGVELPTVETLSGQIVGCQWQYLNPEKPDFILDGPNLADDYYRNLVDWSTNNILAVALGSSLYLWDATSRNAECLFSRNYVEDHPTSVAWSADGRTLAIGFKNSRIELWDAETLHRVRTIEKHRARVGSLSWNCNVLTSGSQDASIINHDVRISRRPASYYMGHKGNVCGLRWSENGSQLASGGGDSLVHVYESSNTSKYLHRFDGHCAAVRALAWCPFKSKLLASGGGSTADRSVKLWDTNSGECINSIDTGAQVCALEWNRHEKEILSAHGYSKYRLNLWAYPSMHKSAEFVGHTGRVLHMSQNPEGSMVVSAGADEALLFWKIFEPPPSSISRRNTDESDSPLSLKRMHIR